MSEPDRVALHDDPVVDVVLTEALATGELPAVVAVVDDADAAFVAPLLAQGVREVRLFSDFGVRDALVDGAAQVTPDAGLFSGVELVVGRLPKSLAELEDVSETVAREASPDVRLILGARVKHLVHSMNERLGKHFTEVRGSRGIRKSRALVATSPRTDLPPDPVFPVVAYLEELDLNVAARGGAFAGTMLDLGTRVLIEALASEDELGRGEAVSTAVDLGCGTGLLACVLARSLPEAKVIATDASWWACASAEATAEANQLADRIDVLRGNAGDGIAEASVDVVLCNPPFHDGRQVDPGLANELFRGAARMLRSGGVIYTVFNSHLKHREHLERIVGPTRQVARTAKFTVTATTRR
ncbi:MAG: class I SAM-dependent methyltransferase [Gulosibacter sp.]|uniref:class I SAM-dependent methyltransferase n=1 Tax=Gulosibacter sp. TaxID=2817531 RepID=UPI003F93CD7C